MDTKDFYLGCCESEHGIDRKVFEAVPGDKLDWTPEPKARSARQLIGHMIGHVQDVIELVDDGVVNHRNVVAFDSLPEALDLYDAATGELRQKVAAMDDESWSRNVQFKVGDHVAMEAPAGQVAWLLMFDSIHHRGQLSTYLRPMGSKVPAMDGTSADDDGSGS